MFNVHISIMFILCCATFQVYSRGARKEGVLIQSGCVHLSPFQLFSFPLVLILEYCLQQLEARQYSTLSNSAEICYYWVERMSLLQDSTDQLNSDEHRGDRNTFIHLPSLLQCSESAIQIDLFCLRTNNPFHVAVLIYRKSAVQCNYEHCNWLNYLILYYQLHIYVSTVYYQAGFSSVNLNEIRRPHGTHQPGTSGSHLVEQPSVTL